MLSSQVFFDDYIKEHCIGGKITYYSSKTNLPVMVE